MGEALDKLVTLTQIKGGYEKMVDGKVGPGVSVDALKKVKEQTAQTAKKSARD